MSTVKQPTVISPTAIEAARRALELDVAIISRTLAAYPRGPMGLTLDAAKTPGWHAARLAYNRAFQALQRFNHAHGPSRRARA